LNKIWYFTNIGYKYTKTEEKVIFNMVSILLEGLFTMQILQIYSDKYFYLIDNHNVLECFCAIFFLIAFCLVILIIKMFLKELKEKALIHFKITLIILSEGNEIITTYSIESLP
jgi:hypothetical protein